MSEREKIINFVEIKLLQANPEYAYIQKPDGKENLVSLRDLVSLPDEQELIKGNLQGNLTGSEAGPYSSTGRNEED